MSQTATAATAPCHHRPPFSGPNRTRLIWTSRIGQAKFDYHKYPHSSSSYLLVQVLHVVGGDTVPDVAAVRPLVQLLVLLDEVPPYIGHVGVQILGLGVVAGEAPGMGDVQAAVEGSLHSVKHMHEGLS